MHLNFMCYVHWTYSVSLKAYILNSSLRLIVQNIFFVLSTLIAWFTKEKHTLWKKQAFISLNNSLKGGLARKRTKTIKSLLSRDVISITMTNIYIYMENIFEISERIILMRKREIWWFIVRHVNFKNPVCLQYFYFTL